MSEQREATRKILHFLEVYRRGIACQAVFWEWMEDTLTPENAAGVLDGLPEERTIRDPRSSWNGLGCSDRKGGSDPTHREIERWCVDQRSLGRASGEL